MHIIVLSIFKRTYRSANVTDDAVVLLLLRLVVLESNIDLVPALLLKLLQSSLHLQLRNGCRTYKMIKFSEYFISNIWTTDSIIAVYEIIYCWPHCTIIVHKNVS